MSEVIVETFSDARAAGLPYSVFVEGEVVDVEGGEAVALVRSGTASVRCKGPMETGLYRVKRVVDNGRSMVLTSERKAPAKQPEPPKEPPKDQSVAVDPTAAGTATPDPAAE